VYELVPRKDEGKLCGIFLQQEKRKKAGKKTKGEDPLESREIFVCTFSCSLLRVRSGRQTLCPHENENPPEPQQFLGMRKEQFRESRKEKESECSFWFFFVCVVGLFSFFRALCFSSFSLFNFSPLQGALALSPIKKRERRSVPSPLKKREDKTVDKKGAIGGNLSVEDKNEEREERPFL
jgi:hypothetical protein